MAADEEVQLVENMVYLGKMATKEDIRASIRKIRMDCADMTAESAAVCRRIEAMPEFKAARTVLSYRPMKGEIDVSLLDCRGKEVILADCDWTEIPAGEIDFAIVPGVAFDRELRRLGRGGGYYDRLLPLMRCTSVGAAFVWQIVDRVPCDPWDCPVDAVATPEEIISTRSGEH